MKKIKKNNLECVFSEIVRLANAKSLMSIADAERKFSSMKIINSRLRSRMSKNRLNALGILSMKKSLTCEKVKEGNSSM